MFPLLQRSLRGAWVFVGILLAGGMLSMLAGQEPQQEDRKKDKEALPPTATAMHTVVVELADGGRLQVSLETESLEIHSPYGKLAIPVGEIVSVELATRLPPEVSRKIEEAIFGLGSLDFARREAAQKELLRLEEKAYPALLEATRHADLEIAQRANELLAKLRDTLPAEKLVVRRYDVITTDHSKISGAITGEALAVRTTQFGPQQLKLSDVLVVRSTKAPLPEEDPIDVQPDPGNLVGHREAIGKTMAFRVTARGDGAVWGTGFYTSDSTLATAAVHAGALKPGETGIVRVKILAPMPAYASSTQNGVSSYAFGPYPGSYQVLVPKP